MAVQLEYATDEATEPSKIALRTAYICAIVPLGIGIICFLAWLPTHATILARIGIIDLILGVGCAVLGFVCLGIYIWQASQFRPPKRGVLLRRALWAALLIVMNFPAAIGIMVAVGFLWRGN